MKLYKKSFRHFTHVFFQNKEDREFFISHKIVKKGGSSIVNGTGVDLEEFKPSSLPEKLTFFMAARLIKEKGVFQFVEAAQFLKKEYPQVRFVLAGAIDTNPSAITQEQLNTYSESVEYMGHCSDMKKALQNCSVFIYPSYYREGIPRALLEALACGRPVITTNSIGCKEAVVDHKNGLAIEARNTHELIKAMKFFIENPDKCELMGKSSRQLAEEKFNIHQINQQILQVIQQKD